VIYEPFNFLFIGVSSRADIGGGQLEGSEGCNAVSSKIPLQKLQAAVFLTLLAAWTSGMFIGVL
jgi:hypothetical protein